MLSGLVFNHGTELKAQVAARGGARTEDFFRRSLTRCTRAHFIALAGRNMDILLVCSRIDLGHELKAQVADHDGAWAEGSFHWLPARRARTYLDALAGGSIALHLTHSQIDCGKIISHENFRGVSRAGHRAVYSEVGEGACFCFERVYYYIITRII